MSVTSLFILDEDEVLGPFSEAEVDEKLSSGGFKNPLVWWRGLPEWLPRGEWKKQFAEVKSKSLAKAERLWKIRVSGGEPALMSQKQMLDYLRHESDLASVEIWTEGYQEWQEVFQIHPIMEELGISRRKHPRVPLSGTVTIQANGQNIEAEPRTISEGGLGLAGVNQLEIGQRVALVIRSSQLYLTIHTNAEVVFASRQGIVGLKFDGLGSEGRAAVIEYVKKFMNQSKA